jgi:hypothetical protein
MRFSCLGTYQEVGLVIRQARQLGITVPLFGGDGLEAPELLQIAKEAAEGTYYTTHYSPETQTPEVQNFVKAYRAKYGDTPDAMAALGYDSALVLVDAIKRAGTTEGPKLRDAIAATAGLKGVTGTTKIDQNRDATKPATGDYDQGRKVSVRRYDPAGAVNFNSILPPDRIFSASHQWRFGRGDLRPDRAGLYDGLRSAALHQFRAQRRVHGGGVRRVFHRAVLPGEIDLGRACGSVRGDGYLRDPRCDD